MKQCIVLDPTMRKLCSSAEDSGAAGGSGGGGGGNSQNFMKQFQNFIAPVLLIAFLYSSVLFGPHDQKQVIDSATILQKFK